MSNAAEDYSGAAVHISDLERGVIEGPVKAYDHMLDPKQAQETIETQISRIYHYYGGIAKTVLDGATGPYDPTKLREELAVTGAERLELGGTEADAIRSLIAMAVFAGYVGGRGEESKDNE